MTDNLFDCLHRHLDRKSAFLDDSLLLAELKQSCVKNVFDTVQLLRTVGFIVHPEKSVLEPMHRIQYLGVIIDAQDMKVTLTPERVTIW